MAEFFETNGFNTFFINVNEKSAIAIGKTGLRFGKVGGLGAGLIFGKKFFLVIYS